MLFSVSGFIRYADAGLAINGVFVVGLLNDVRKIPPRPTPVAMATKIWKKVGNYSAFAEDTSELLAHSRGFSG